MADLVPGRLDVAERRLRESLSVFRSVHGTPHPEIEDVPAEDAPGIRERRIKAGDA